MLALEEQLFAPDCWTAELFWSELAQRDTRCYLVWRDGAGIAGYAGLAVYGPDASVQTLGVAASRQGQGLGRALLLALLAEAERRGARRVGLEVRVDNAGARRLYERAGFVPLGVRRGYYQPSGTDALVMTRPLGS